MEQTASAERCVRARAHPERRRRRACETIPRGGAAAARSHTVHASTTDEFDAPSLAQLTSRAVKSTVRERSADPLLRQAPSGCTAEMRARSAEEPC